ncbi:hypothetical protein [Kytococcus sedentarius]|uniref:hypothetical protein n=1 Tax=Kytococcus sedentarius TaxID=1276 RepID=UPI00384A513F
MISNTTTRRTVMRSAAWTAPAVVVAGSAPALAASPCEPTPVTVDWESANYTRKSAYEGVYTIPLSDGSTLTMTLNSVFTSMRPGGVAGGGLSSNDNLRLSQFNIGGTGEPGLVLHQNDKLHQRQNGYQTLTVTFSRTISSISFAVTDIDWLRTDFRDAVRPSGNLTAVPSSGVRLSPSTDPRFRGYYRKETPGVTNNDDPASNLQLSGTNLTSFTLQYANFDQDYDRHDDRDQAVFLTDFDITVPPTGC